MILVQNNFFTDGSYGENAIVFGAGISSFAHVDNKRKYKLILGEEPIQVLNAEAEAITNSRSKISY